MFSTLQGPPGPQGDRGQPGTRGPMVSWAPITCAHTRAICRNLLAKKRSAGQELPYLFYLTMIVIKCVPRFPQDDIQADGGNAFLFRFSGLARQTRFTRISWPTWRDGKFYFDFCNTILQK